jgi:tetratricopeptide (TPR) repeat protein
MTLLRCSLALSLFLAVFGPAASAQTPQAKIEPITSALRAKEFDKAAELSRSALKEFPNDAQLWTLQGVALASEGDAQSGRAAFQRALKISPNHIMALQGAAQLEFQTGGREAPVLLNRLLRLRPGDETAHAMLGVLQYRQGDCASAAPHFENAGELLDSQPAALHAYAICLVRLKKMDSAVSVFRRTLTLSGGDPQERRLLAAIQVMAHKPNDAVATLRPILQSGTADAEVLALAAAAFEDSGDTPDAVDALRRAILLEPKNVSLYLDFAHISFLHQSFAVGIGVVGEGIAQQPTAARLYVARGILYVQLADYEKAEADFDKAYELDPNQSLSTAAQGMAAVQANDLDRALATVKSKLTRKPNDALLLYLQADILSQKGAAPGSPEFQTAMSSARRAVAVQPTLGEARAVLAKLDLLAGRNQEAVEQCRKALDSNPKDQTALYRLIQALQKTGDRREIPELLKRLATVREQAAREDRERSRYRLVDKDDIPDTQPARR